jgi:beta-lactamase class A
MRSRLLLVAVLSITATGSGCSGGTPSGELRAARLPTVLAREVDDVMGVPEATTGYLLRRTDGAVLKAKNTGVIFEPASAIKVAVELHAMLELQAGRLSLDQPVDAVAQVDGTCPRWPATTYPEPLRGALEKMMILSDNARTDAVRRRLGDAAIQSTLAAIGAPSTRLDHRIGCAVLANADQNEMTLDDADRIYAAAFTGDLLDQTHQALMRSQMRGALSQFWAVALDEANRTFGKPTLPPVFGTGVRMSYKSGTYGLCKDGCREYRAVLGFLELPYNTAHGTTTRTYTFGAFVHGALDEPDADFAISHGLEELLRDEIRASLATFYRPPVVEKLLAAE